jgi:transcriptional regulator with XRE-family HTH domain
MPQKFPIDSAWFFEQLKQRAKSLRGLARYMDMDPAAVSRMLNGQRNMSAAEQDRVAEFLDIGLLQIAAHRGALQPGFEERKQEGYAADDGPSPVEAVEMFTEGDIIYEDGERWIQGPDGLLALHPIFGCMKGTMIIPPDLDLTAPIDDVEWSDKIYNE